MTEKAIQSGFAATGFVPFNPDRVLSTLNPVLRTPSLVPTEESVWESKTPRTIKEIKRQGQHIQAQRQLRTNTSRSPSDSAFQQLLSSSTVYSCVIRLGQYYTTRLHCLAIAAQRSDYQDKQVQ
jgi:hypothetical protein